MAEENLKVQSLKGKGDKQEILGVSVMKVRGEFLFNYSTKINPRDLDTDCLKDFRNEFVKRLEEMNIILENLTE